MKAPTMRWALLSLALLAPLASANDWPRFRGADGLSISNDDKVPTEWSDGKNVKWKLDLPGRGYSSPIIVGDFVFVTSYTGSDSSLKRQLVCVNRKTGKA